MRNISLAPLALVLFTITSAAACGKNGASPVAPSTTASTSASAGATISGTVVSAARVAVSIVGTSIATTADDGGNFTLRNVPAGSPTLSLSGSSVSAQVMVPEVSANQQVRVTVVVTGSTATLDEQERESADNQAEVEGRIVSVSGNTLVVGRQNITVTVPSGTPITQDGVAKTLADLTVGTKVDIKGTLSGSTIVATSVRIEGGSNSGSGSNGGGSSGDDGKNGGSSDDGSNGGTRKEVSGAISSAPTGTCPTLAFTVGTTKVKTDGTTKFTNVACTALALGDTLAVEGALQSDGTLLALELTRTNAGGNGKDVEFSGAVTVAPTGTCPTVTLTVGTTVVKTTAATRFDKSGCSAIAKGDQVKGEGTTQSDGSILASELEDDSTDENQDVKFSGTLTAAPTGSCPAITFTLGSQKISTNSSTNFSGSGCSSIVSGAKVSGEGVLQKDGSILATEVDKSGGSGKD